MSDAAVRLLNANWRPEFAARPVLADNSFLWLYPSQAVVLLSSFELRPGATTIDVP